MLGGKILRGKGRIIAGVKVYIEVVIVNNLAVDALIVYAVLLLRRRKVMPLRFIAAVLAGAAAATAYPLLPEWGRLLVRVALAPLMTAVFLKHRGIKDYIVSLALFLVVTFALGGTVTGASYLAGFDLGGYLVLGVVAAAALALLVAVRCILSVRAKTSRRVCPAKIAVGGEEFSVDALLDTGNTLTDSVSGLPVIIVSERFAAGVDGWHGRERAANIEGFVELGTVGGNASLPIVKVDGVSVGGRVTAAYAALSERNFEGYEVILQNTMF